MCDEGEVGGGGGGGDGRGGRNGNSAISNKVITSSIVR